LQLNGEVGKETFGFDRYLNQVFYHSPEWKRLRNKIIIRDQGRDLAMINHDILGRVYIHHMNPIMLRDIDERNPDIMNPEFLVCCSHKTHNAIHYGDENLIKEPTLVERRPNDTCPWKN
jgi:hypothetical protein